MRCHSAHIRAGTGYYDKNYKVVCKLDIDKTLFDLSPNGSELEIKQPVRWINDIHFTPAYYCAWDIIRMIVEVRYYLIDYLI